LPARIDGYSAGFTWATALILVATVVSAVLIKVNEDDLPAAESEPMA